MEYTTFESHRRSVQDLQDAYSGLVKQFQMQSPVGISPPVTCNDDLLPAAHNTTDQIKELQSQLDERRSQEQRMLNLIQSLVASKAEDSKVIMDQLQSNQNRYENHFKLKISVSRFFFLFLALPLDLGLEDRSICVKFTNLSSTRTSIGNRAKNR